MLGSDLLDESESIYLNTNEPFVAMIVGVQGLMADYSCCFSFERVRRLKI